MKSSAKRVIFWDIINFQGKSAVVSAEFVTKRAVTFAVQNKDLHFR